MKISNLIRWVCPEDGTHWNRVRVYSSPTEMGTYTVLKEMDIKNTSYWDEFSPSTYFYYVTFYDSTNNVESPPSTLFSTSTIPAIKPQELRRFMALSPYQEPEDNVLLSLMVDANTELLLDLPQPVPTSSMKLALKFLSASYVCQNRAQNLVNRGNVNFAIDGVSIQKPFRDLMEQAKYYRQMYDEFIWKYAEESMTSMPVRDAGYNEWSFVLVELINGVSNAKNKQDYRYVGLSNSTAYIPI